MSGDNSKEIKESPDDVINQITLMEVVVKKHRDQTETIQLICREDLMINHKAFLIRKLMTCIDIVLSATKRNKNQVVVGSEGMINRMKNRVKGAFGK